MRLTARVITQADTKVGFSDPGGFRMEGPAWRKGFESLNRSQLAIDRIRTQRVTFLYFVRPSLLAKTNRNQSRLKLRIEFLCGQEGDRGRLDKAGSVLKLANASEFVSGKALAAGFVWSPAASASPLSHCGIEPRMTRLLDL